MTDAMNAVTADRGALVDVRHPGVEGHRANLEEQPNRDKGGTDQQQRVQRKCCEPSASWMSREADGSGVPEEQRRAKEQERRGEGTQQEVLQRRFLREQATATRQPDHQVQRQRQHFKRDKQHQQVVGGRERASSQPPRTSPVAKSRSASHPAAVNSRSRQAARDSGRGRGKRVTASVNAAFGEQQECNRATTATRCPARTQQVCPSSTVPCAANRAHPHCASPKPAQGTRRPTRPVPAAFATGDEEPAAQTPQRVHR